MARWIMVWTLLGVCEVFVGDARGQPKAQQEDAHAAAFAQLGGSDLAGIYKGYEYLSQAGKWDPAIPPRLAQMVWDQRLSETSRSWALRTLAEIGPAAKAVMPDLVRAMEDKDPYFQLRGSLAVLRAGGPAEKPLATLKALVRGKDPFVRRESLLALKEAGPAAKDALPFLTDIAREADNPQRDIAVRAIGAVGPAAKDSVRLLVKLLGEEDKKVREAAVQALCELAPDVPEAIQPLLKFVSQDGSEGYVVAEALARCGKPVVPALITLLQSDNPIARAHAAHALRFMGRGAAPAAEVLAKAVPRLMPDSGRRDAIHALSNSGTAGIPYLVGLLNNPEVQAKAEVAEAIGTMGPEAKTAVPALVALLKSPDIDLRDRRAAGEALAKIGPGAAAAIPDLIILIRDEKRDISELAIRTLGAIGPEAKEAIKPLVEMIQADNRLGRYSNGADEAAKALGQIGKAAESAVPVLIEMLSHARSPYVAESLGLFGPVAKHALPKLRELYKAENFRLRIAAALAVTRIDPEATDGIEALVQWLTTPTSQFPEFEQQAAAAALGAIGPRAKAALESLRKLLDDRTQTSAQAALAIYRINPGDTAALESLIRTLTSNETFGPAAACGALGEIGPPARAALTALRRVAQFHSGYYERDSARWAIRAIDPSQEP